MAKAESTPSSSETEDVSLENAKSIYADFAVWTDRKKAPKWHPIKKMRYVFYRMINGCTITDALKEIRWSASEFWYLIDLKRNDPFRVEYMQAKMLQSRAIADSVIQISEGRDRTTRKHLAKMKKIIKRSLLRAGKQKTAFAAKQVIESMIAQLNEYDAKIISRNKIQIDAAKWMAKSLNPNEFSEKSSVALSGAHPSGDGAPVAPISIQFIAPDGSVVVPFTVPEANETAH